MHKSEWFLAVMVLVFFATGIALYPYLPAQIATHWDAAGQVNGSMAREEGAFLIPIIFLIIAAIFFAIPRMDPRRDNIAKFRKYFDYFLVAFGLLFYYIYLLTLFWNLGYSFDMTSFLVPAIALFFYVIGAILPHTKPNWTIGIRTPWTISNDTVWKKTHQASGPAFKISAVIALLGLSFPVFAIWFLVVPLIVSAIALVIYSYVLYEGKRG
jgi:uncharacterized membrane protein